MENNRQFIKKLWLYLIILVIGVSLKFYKIDSRYFWYDEICTVMHTSGIKEIDYVKMFPENEIKNISIVLGSIGLPPETTKSDETKEAA